MGQGMGALVQILQVSDASQDAHEEDQHLGLRRMNDALLRNRQLTQFLNQTDLVGEPVPSYHRGVLVDDLYGVIVRLAYGRRKYDFPLCDLEVTDKRSPNDQIVKDYAVWFANR